MRILWIGIALCLSIGRVQGMDEEDKVMRDARYYVRPVVLKNLGEYVARNSSQKKKLGTDLYIFQRQIYLREFVCFLNKDIIDFLNNGKDPAYLGCSYSFRGVKETLTEVGITLAQDGIILKNTEEISLNSFVESPLLTKDQPSSSSSWCCFL